MENSWEVGGPSAGSKMTQCGFQNSIQKTPYNSGKVPLRFSCNRWKGRLLNSQTSFLLLLVNKIREVYSAYRRLIQARLYTRTPIVCIPLTLGEPTEYVQTVAALQTR
ncbi:hypothetical protein TNCV_2340301 [Trichonephila clavipes]|nr:hypothetical protein TNCV_2340301 [Trichonephila clavipes]